LTGAKRSAFSTNHLTDIDKTKHNYNQKQHKNPNNRTRKPLRYAQTEANEAKAWYMDFFTIWLSDQNLGLSLIWYKLTTQLGCSV